MTGVQTCALPIYIPEDICHDTWGFADADFAVSPGRFSVPAQRCRPAVEDLEQAAQMLRRAVRPLILAGGGVHISGAASALQHLAQLCAIPVAHTMTGKGAIACTHRLSAGLFGRYDRIANQLIEDSDCLLVIGCKLGEIATKRYSLIPPETPLLHLDIFSNEFS